MKRPVIAGAVATLLAACASLPGVPAVAQALPRPAVAPIAPANARVAPASAPAAVRPAGNLTQAQRAPVLIVLPAPPAITNTTSSRLFRALLAVTRAQRIDPQAAQTAAFAYTQAVQQYRLGNFAAANVSALSALATAGTAQVRSIAPAPLPTAALVSQPPQLPGLSGGLYGADAPAIDADSFLALARGIIDDCSARHDRKLPEAQAQYALAEQAFAARNWQATRLAAKAAIDACAKPQP